MTYPLGVASKQTIHVSSFRKFWIGALLVLFLVFTRPCQGAAAGGWEDFERRVRDDHISVEEGQTEIRRWWGIFQTEYPPERFDGRLHFPLKGYGVTHVGGRRGEGYRPSRYRFVGPRRRIGHPAQDIFVYDGNQDSLDDKTGAPIEVLALADGVVVSTFAEWSPLPEEPWNGKRGGNYVWIYHPALQLLGYYAHLREIRASVGDRVSGGRVIATLGRTGTNAYAERSPTHLHLMLLRASDMTPVDPYPFLRKAHETR